MAKQLAEPLPYDLSEIDLRHYRRLAPRWQEWQSVVTAARAVAIAMLDRLAEDKQ